MIEKTDMEICQVPKVIEFQYHNEQQRNSIITISNNYDRVVNYKIKSNRPELYLVKPMEGSIYKKDSVRITFKRKELQKSDFEAYLRNPNAFPSQRFLIEIKYSEQDAIGRQKIIVQEAYTTVRFRGSTSLNSSLQKQNERESRSKTLIENRQKQKQIKQLTQTIQLKEKQLNGIEEMISAYDNSKETQNPILLKDVIILLIISLLAGLAF